ncbi:MAG: SDR family NAD(P)-dependent oxidoreductase [Bacteroidota bacterium]
MQKEQSTERSLKHLVQISRYYGADKEAVIAGGGNTSFKNDEFIWVKASGIGLDTIDESGFVKLYREKLQKIATAQFSDNSDERELQVKNALFEACFDPATAKRPSVETSLHDILNYPFVVHLHPTLVNALMCGKDSQKITRDLFGDEALYIPYTDTGYVLFKKVEKEVKSYRSKFGNDPQLLFLENHGVFLSASSTEQIKVLYKQMIEKIKSLIEEDYSWKALPVKLEITKILPALRMFLSKDGLKTLTIRNNTLIEHFSKSNKMFEQISRPFSPDIIVYCKSNYLYIEETGKPDKIVSVLRQKVNVFEKEYGYLPKVILIKGLGLITAEDNARSALTAIDVFEDLMKISYLSKWFGGPRYMTNEQIQFIENWELENYRRKVSKGDASPGKVAGKTAVVTGGAMGFGAGIAEDLFRQGANIVIADINPIEAENMLDKLKKYDQKNQVIFQKTDVSDEGSVIELIRKTIETFGGIDLFVSNAGILRAGSLDTMDAETFDWVTKVNYNAYFLCVKYAAEVMKLQNQSMKSHFTDIIQINSKSGLKGSNKNFAYAGSKFGGVGLTQSFALELMPYRIKVNSVCPGNFFDGPLWSDPKKGLFVQYLQAGKVPGAKTVKEVKKHYENQVPAGRGCMIEDVMKAIYYAIDQKYETGQAIPVTGGQVMMH